MLTPQRNKIEACPDSISPKDQIFSSKIMEFGIRKTHVRTPRNSPSGIRIRRAKYLNHLQAQLQNNEKKYRKKKKESRQIPGLLGLVFVGLRCFFCESRQFPISLKALLLSLSLSLSLSQASRSWVLRLSLSLCSL